MSVYMFMIIFGRRIFTLFVYNCIYMYICMCIVISFIFLYFQIDRLQYIT